MAIIWGWGWICISVSARPNSMRPCALAPARRSRNTLWVHVGPRRLHGPGSLPSPHRATDTGVISSDRWLNRALVRGRQQTKGWRIYVGPVSLVFSWELRVLSIFRFAARLWYSALSEQREWDIAGCALQSANLFNLLRIIEIPPDVRYWGTLYYGEKLLF